MEYPKVEFFTTHPKLEAGREQTVDVLIRITPPALSLDPSSRSNWKGRSDLNLSLVLDRSGSMEGEKMVRAREAAMFCVDQMLPTDRLSVVTFDDRIEVLFPSEPVTNKDDIGAQAMGLYQRGVSTSTVGIGADFNEDLLMPMAQAGGGNKSSLK